MTHSDAPPRIDPRQLRPARKWYVVAGMVAVLGILAGGGLGAVGMTSVMRDLPNLVAEFDAGEPARVSLTGSREWAVYAATDAGQTIGGARAECIVTGPDGREAPVRSAPYAFTFSRGDHSWVAVGEFSSATAGNYQVSCADTSSRNHYAVGERPEVQGFVTGIVGSLAALIGLPCVALFAGGVIGLVVAVRRSSHRTRLLAAAAGSDPPDPPLAV